jgi:hypothetical protein
MPPLDEESSMADDLRAAMQEVETAAPEPESTSAVNEDTSFSQEQSDARARDDQGRFAPRTPANPEDKASPVAEPKQVAEQPAVEKPVEQAQPAEQPQGARPPVSWTPAAREEWAKVPLLVQQEVMRREREITQTLAQTAEARNFHGEFTRTVQPYMHDIQAENSTPMKAVESLLNTAGWLRRGNTQQKANVVANIIKTYGVDINALDDVLASGQMDGTVYPQNAQGRQSNFDPAILSAIEQRFAPTMQFVQSLQERMQQGEQAKVQELTTASEQFLNDPANEFAWDVKDDMADILDLAAKRGQQMSLQEAYRRATMLHPEISKVLETRKPVQEPLSEAAIRAKKAASVSSANSGAPVGDDEDDEQSGDLRSDLRSSIRKMASRS